MNQSVNKEKLDELAAQAVRARSAGELEAAERLYLEILGLAPEHQGALHDLGVIATLSGRLRQAVDWYERVLRAAPSAVDAHSNLGVVLRELGDVARARHHLSEAVRLRPDYAVAHGNLGALLIAIGDVEAAHAHLLRAAELDPGDAAAWANAGKALLLARRPRAALEPLQRAVALAPEMTEARAALGTALFMLERYAQGVAVLQTVREEWPERVEVLSDLVHMRQHLCEWQGLNEQAVEIRRYVTTADRCAISPFHFVVLPGTTALEQRLCAEKYVRNRHGASDPTRRRSASVAGGGAPRRLRIGYLHENFGEHATLHLLVGVLERHDRDRFEVVGLSYGDAPAKGAGRARAALDDHLALDARNDARAADAIEARGIDILIDVQGYNRRARPGILVSHPAPVQVAYLVHPATTGAPYIDYVIADRFVVPPEHAVAYTERIKYLPHSYQCNDDRRVVADRPARSECGLPGNVVVFCCFNQTAKITSEVFDVWCRLLREASGSVLWLWASNADAVGNLRREAQARDVAPERLVFAPTLPAAQHRARIALADLFLDTHPCNAHTTASDALWAGVPLVTCSGATFVSRVAGSLLHAVGLPELITTTLADYEALALRLARNPDELRALRQRLAVNRATAPLFDTRQQTRDLESVYEEMWRECLERARRP